MPGSLIPLKHHLAKFKCTCCFFMHAPRHALPVQSSRTMDNHRGTNVPSETAALNLLSCTEMCKTMPHSKSTSFTCAAPYQPRFKEPQSCCFPREWLYGFELCFQTPWLMISTPLEMVTLRWQVTQREKAHSLAACSLPKLFDDCSKSIETSTDN